VIPVRFSEHERYDINLDCDKRVMIASTPRGSYFAEIVDEGSAKYREAKTRFKEIVVDCLTKNIDPCEIDLNA